MSNKKILRVNDRIKVPRVRVIDEDGAQLGVLLTSEALRMGQEAGLDLVEVSPLADPPVCRLLNYGRFRFEQEKKMREQRKNQKVTKLKEVRMQPKIEEHDVKFKSRHIQEFLDDGYKVKVTIRFRGRELAHTNLLGGAVFKRINENLEEGSYVVDSEPRMEGRLMSMLLSPRKRKVDA